MTEHAIKLGDVMDGLRTLPDCCVQCTVTSPPYWMLRNYGVDGQIGLEETMDGYIQAMVDVFHEVKRVTRDDGILWLNLGDCYSGSNSTKSAAINPDSISYNMGQTKGGIEKAKGVVEGLKAKDLCGIPWRVAFALQADGWYLRSAIPWIKRNCLSGGTWLYVKSQKGVMPMTVKDMARLDPATVQLWNGQKWTQVIDIWKTETESPLEVVLRSGERIGCTGDHKFPLKDGSIKSASELKPGDLLIECTLPDQLECLPKLPAYEIGRFIGLYLAEGSKGGNGDTIQIASHIKEKGRFEFLSNLASAYHGKSYLFAKEGKAATLNINSKVLMGILDTYIFGNSAKTKHLTNACWQRSNEFLYALLMGYLEGDGHYDAENQRYRLGFTRNYSLERDLRVICARLGFQLTLNMAHSKMGDRTFPSFRGEIRKVKVDHQNSRDRCEIVEVRKSRGRGFWDIEVQDDPHLFSLASGILTHNCMPESCTDRPTSAIEYVFLMTKSAKYFYDGEAVRVPVSGGTQARGTYKGDLPKTQEPGQGIKQNSSWTKACWAQPEGTGKKKKANKQDQTGNPTYTGFNERWKGKHSTTEEQSPGNRVLKSVKAAREESGSHDQPYGDTRNFRNSDPFFESWQGLYSESENPLAFIINPQSRPELHFATFPDLLVATCIKAGTSERGCCPKCGKPWERVVEVTGGTIGEIWHPHADDETTGQIGGMPTKGYKREFKGWKPGCKCDAGEPTSCLVLDPFMGSGTGAVVARELNRSSVGCELNPEYVKIIRARLQVDSQLDTGLVTYKFEDVRKPS